jgi:stalled ribosome rescue protein Dom34
MTTPHFHKVIWIDHHEAKVFNFNLTDSELITLSPENLSLHVHHKANTVGNGHETLIHTFLHEIATAVASAGEVLIAGSRNAKTEPVKHINQHDPKLKEKILGVETADHPSDRQIVAYARKFFKSADSIRSQ